MLLALACTARVAAQDAQVDFSALDSTVAAEMAAMHIPGAAVGVVYGGRVVYAKGFGVASLDDPRPVTPDMLFRIGSVTKMFTAAALVALAEDRHLDLQAPIGTYADSLDAALAGLTVHQLLTHTAGLRDDGAPYGPDDEAALARQVRSWGKDRLFAAPGAVHSYASPGYWLAGYVLEQLTGRRYADAMDSLLFKPLGMARTTLRPLIAVTYPLALGHLAADDSVYVGRPIANNAVTWPAGSIFSSVNDLARFVRAVVQPDDGTASLPSAVPEQLFYPHVAIPGSGEAHYGYGTTVLDYRGVRLVYHGGFSQGYGAFIEMAPAHGFGVILLANKSGGVLFQSAEKAIELLLPLTSPPPAPPAAAVSLNPIEQSQGAGLYRQGDLTQEIFARDGQLYLRQDSVDYALTKTRDFVFVYGPEGQQEIALVPGPDGRLAYLFDGLYAYRKETAEARP